MDAVCIFTTLVSLLFLVAGDTVPTDQLRICTTANCPNDHVLVTEGPDGPVHRYSKNAANFHEAKAPPNPSRVPEDSSRKRLDPVSFGLPDKSPGDRHSVSENGHRRGSGAHLDITNGGSKSEGSVLGADGQVTTDQGYQMEQNQLPKQRQASRQQRRGSNHSNSQLPERGLPQNVDLSHAVEDGMFWSMAIEAAIPLGLSDAAVEAWNRRARELRVILVENGTQERCGSEKNRYVVFEDGTPTCARYRHPRNHLVFGDLYCYYLAKLLNLRNVPAIVLSKVSNDSSSQWSFVAEDLRAAGWDNGNVASFSLWIDGLGKSELPEIFFENMRGTIYPDTPGLGALNLTELVELAQYSDLIVFDYITGHLDRMTIRKNAVDYYKMDWIYRGEVHNLAKHKTNGGLWFLDNENGIFNAYTVVYDDKNYKQMHGYHEELLQSMCIFRRSTVAAIRRLAAMKDPFPVLNSIVAKAEPIISAEPEAQMWIKQPGLHGIFKERVTAVADWMTKCSSQTTK